MLSLMDSQHQAVGTDTAWLMEALLACQPTHPPPHHAADLATLAILLFERIPALTLETTATFCAAPLEDPTAATAANPAAAAAAAASQTAASAILPVCMAAHVAPCFTHQSPISSDGDTEMCLDTSPTLPAPSTGPNLTSQLLPLLHVLLRLITNSSSIQQPILHALHLPSHLVPCTLRRPSLGATRSQGLMRDAGALDSQTGLVDSHRHLAGSQTLPTGVENTVPAANGHSLLSTLLACLSGVTGDAAVLRAALRCALEIAARGERCVSGLSRASEGGSAVLRAALRCASGIAARPERCAPHLSGVSDVVASC